MSLEVRPALLPKSLRRPMVPSAGERLLPVRGWILAMLAADASVAGLAGIASRVFRFGDSQASVLGLPYFLVAAALPALWVLVLALAGAYDGRFLPSGPEMFKRTFNAGIGFLAGAAIASYVLRADLSRAFLLLAVPVMTFGTLVARYGLRQLIHHRVAAGESVHRVLVIGSRHEVLELTRHMSRAPHAGFTVVGSLALAGGRRAGDGLEELDRLPEMIHELGADTIAVAGSSALPSGELRKLAWRLEGQNVTLIVAPAVTDFAGPRILVRPVDGLPLLYIEEPELSGIRKAVKHAMDRVVALIGMVAISPLLAAIAIAIKIADGGPVFFTQIRVGQNGREFPMWKFRTMVVDAEQRLPQVVDLNEHDGLLFKIRHDPRVTQVGRFLRRHSLDELPQLWNVIRGDMSLVGPRPPLPREVAMYGEDTKRRLLVRPGLTGLWQISGRADLSWDESVRLDLHYVENWSVALDAMVVWKTLLVVFAGKGGY